jgi:hypothetical protein
VDPSLTDSPQTENPEFGFVSQPAPNPAGPPPPPPPPSPNPKTPVGLRSGHRPAPLAARLRAVTLVCAAGAQPPYAIYCNFGL